MSQYFSLFLFPFSILELRQKAVIFRFFAPCDFTNEPEFVTFTLQFYKYLDEI